MCISFVQHFCFVGEKPSKRAIQIGATWENGKLAGKTLKDALVACGLDPAEQMYLNLFNEDLTINLRYSNLAFAMQLVDKWTVVAMGKRVDRELTALNIKHISIVHPAARGKIRKTELYQAQLAEQLGITFKKNEVA
jgi:hypothetical protein